MLERALEISPDNQWYWMRLSEIYYRKENLPKAIEIAKKVLENTRDKRLSDYAQRNLTIIESYRAKLKKEANLAAKPKNYVRDSEGFLTEEEQGKIEESLVVEALNQMLRKPRAGEQRLVGVLARIECGKQGIQYSIETGERSVELKSSTFENLRFAIFNLPWKGENIGCGSSFPDNLVIVTYHPKDYPDSEVIGEVVGIEFVPEYFKFSESISDLQK